MSAESSAAPITRGVRRLTPRGRITALAVVILMAAVVTMAGCGGGGDASASSSGEPSGDVTDAEVDEARQVVETMVGAELAGDYESACDQMTSEGWKDVLSSFDGSSCVERYEAWYDETHTTREGGSFTPKPTESDAVGVTRELRVVDVSLGKLITGDPMEPRAILVEVEGGSPGDAEVTVAGGFFLEYEDGSLRVDSADLRGV